MLPTETVERTSLSGPTMTSLSGLQSDLRNERLWNVADIDVSLRLSR